MSGQVVMMTINETISFWRVFEFEETYLITYEKLYSIFLKELEIFIQKSKPNLDVDMKQVQQQETLLYMLNDTDVSQRMRISNLSNNVPLNCEIIAEINLLKKNGNPDNRTKYKFPTISECEASDLVDKADRVFSLSPRTSLKLIQSASKYSLFEYAEALFLQKKWKKLYKLIDILKEKYPQNTKVSLMIAKCYEALNDSAHSFQAYKEALIFSDDPSLLIECSKLYMNLDKFLSSLLLNRSISCDSSNPKVIMRSMVELINNKKYNDVFNIAFRSIKSLKFLAKLFKKNDELSKNFITFYKNASLSAESLSKEGASLASLLYGNGAVYESLCICHHTLKSSMKQTKIKNGESESSFSKASSDDFNSNSSSGLMEFGGFYDNFSSEKSKTTQSQENSIDGVDPFIARVYFIILLNEGLYKRFVEVSKEFVMNLLISNDFDAFEFLGLRNFFEDYLSITDCKPRNKIMDQHSFDQELRDGFDLHYITSRQLAIIDCVCAISAFLFMIGSCNEIGSFLNINPNLVKVENDMQFWQLRQMFTILHPISESLPALDTSQPSVVLIGDESSLMASYQIIGINRQKDPTNKEDQNNDNQNQNQNQNQKSKKSKDAKNKKDKKDKAASNILTSNYLLLPNIIIDLSLWKLRKGHKCGQKNSFWSRIETFDETPLIIMELGCVDCEYEIPRLMRKNRFSTVHKALDAIIDIYINVIFKIKRKYPKKIVAIHPVITTKSISSPIVYEFNKEMRFKAAQNGIKYLDVFSKYTPLDLAITEKSLIRYRASLRKWLVINDDVDKLTLL